METGQEQGCGRLIRDLPRLPTRSHINRQLALLPCHPSALFPRPRKRKYRRRHSVSKAAASAHFSTHATASRACLLRSLIKLLSSSSTTPRAPSRMAGTNPRRAKTGGIMRLHL
jgi:hypothetical protein